MREIVLDTETTGLDPASGHRIIEIGCVELVDRLLTGNTYHVYINPKRKVEQGAIEVHGITNEFLADKPLFEDIYQEFFDFIKGAQLVIHNAPFDCGFIDHEFKLYRNNHLPVSKICKIMDTLKLAREMHPGQRNNLDALCKRYDISNFQRDYHGALLDSEILAQVYLRMTGGQDSLFGDSKSSHKASADSNSSQANKVFEFFVPDQSLVMQKVSESEQGAHLEYLKFLREQTDDEIADW